MGNNQNKFVCIAKPNVDFTKYGLKDDKTDYNLFLNGLLRIRVNKKGMRKVVFNISTVDSIKVICEMYKDGAISFEPNVKIKRHYLVLTDEEYKLVMEKREQVDD